MLKRISEAAKGAAFVIGASSRDVAKLPACDRTIAKAMTAVKVSRQRGDKAGAEIARELVAELNEARRLIKRGRFIRARLALRAAGVLTAAFVATHAGASESERATALHYGARACGFATTLDESARSADWEASFAASSAVQMAAMPQPIRAEVCGKMRETIRSEGAGLGVRLADAPAAKVCPADQVASPDGTACVGREWTHEEPEQLKEGTRLCLWGRTVEVAGSSSASGRAGYDAILIRYTSGKAKGELGLMLHKRGAALEYGPKCKGRGF